MKFRRNGYDGYYYEDEDGKLYGVVIAHCGGISYSGKVMVNGETKQNDRFWVNEVGRAKAISRCKNWVKRNAQEAL